VRRMLSASSPRGVCVQLTLMVGSLLPGCELPKVLAASVSCRRAPPRFIRLSEARRPASPWKELVLPSRRLDPCSLSCLLAAEAARLHSCLLWMLYMKVCLYLVPKGEVARLRRGIGLPGLPPRISALRRGWSCSA